jgi:hypothetical protein
MRAALLGRKYFFCGAAMMEGFDKEEQEWIALLFDAFEPVPYSPSIMRKTNVATVRMEIASNLPIPENLSFRTSFSKKEGCRRKAPGSGGAYVEEAVEEHHGEGPDTWGISCKDRESSKRPE